jgi:5'-methylthioadenosine nucleosidase
MEGTQEVKDGAGRESSAGDAISTVLLVFAMQAEAMPLVQTLNLTEVDEPSIFPKALPWKKYSGTHEGLTVHVVVPGKDLKLGVDSVGTVPVSMLTYASIVSLHPDLIINAGTAGGFRAKGAAIGDVFVATQFANHDRRIPVPVFDEYGIGTLAATPIPNLVKALELKEGKLSTGNSLDMTPQDEEIIKANDATIKDMEGAAVAYVANLLTVPLIAMKAVTDIVDGDKPTVEEFLGNMSRAAAALSATIPRVLEYVNAKSISNL